MERKIFIQTLNLKLHNLFFIFLFTVLQKKKEMACVVGKENGWIVELSFPAYKIHVGTK